jgi:hypothetical protein
MALKILLIKFKLIIFFVFSLFGCTTSQRSYRFGKFKCKIKRVLPNLVLNASSGFVNGSNEQVNETKVQVNLISACDYK